jgi:TolB protein
MAPAWSPDGRRIAFSASRGEPTDDLFLMRSDGGGVRRVTRTPFVDEWTPRFSPDGTRLLFTSSEMGRQTLLETARLDGSDRTALTQGLSGDWGRG